MSSETTNKTGKIHNTRPAIYLVISVPSRYRYGRMSAGRVSFLTHPGNRTDEVRS